jgi:DNA-binding transcriptional MerR regulator
LTRKEVARALGVKLNAVLRLEEEGSLTPTRTSGGARRYRPAQVAALATRRALERKRAPTEGEIEAAIVTQLREAVPEADIVASLRVPFAVVRRVRAELEGTAALDQDDAEAQTFLRQAADDLTRERAARALAFAQRRKDRSR